MGPGVFFGGSGMFSDGEAVVEPTTGPSSPAPAGWLLLRPLSLGAVGYLVVAAILGAWWGLGVVAAALTGGLAWRIRAARRARLRMEPEVVLSWRPSRLVEAVIAKVVLEEDGLRKVVSWALVATVAAGVAALVGAVVAAVAGHGIPLLAGLVVAVATSWARRRSSRVRAALPGRTW